MKMFIFFMDYNPKVRLGLDSLDTKKIGKNMCQAGVLHIMSKCYYLH